LIFIDYDFPEFDAFCARNAELWRSRPLPQTGRYLAVELLHNNATLLYTNLLIARHLALLYGWRIVGVVADTFLEMPTSKARVIRFARSFGVIDFFDVDMSATVRPERRGLWQRLNAHINRMRVPSLKMERDELILHLSRVTGNSLRREVLSASLGGIWIGDLLYDSFLRLSELSTIERYDERLESSICAAFDHAARYLTLLREYDVAASMTSHTTYLEYGLLVRLVLQQGGAAFGGSASLDAIRLRRFRSIEEAPRAVTDLDLDLVRLFRERYGERLREVSECFFPPRPNGHSHLVYLQYGYGKDKQHLTRDVVVNSLGLDPSRKSVAVMAHMFADAPHANPNNLFDDYGDWLEQTLDHASLIDEVNWLVRQHPYERLVNQTAEFDRIIGKYRTCENIHIVPTSFATSSLYDVVDLTVTVAGTAGLEFAAAGIPCLLAGKPFYSGGGFTIEPTNKESYFAALHQVASYPKLSPDQTSCAKEYAYIHFHQTFVRSSMIPPSADVAGRSLGLNDIAGYWKVAAGLLQPGAIERDPLASFLALMKEQNSPTLFNPSIAA
jgi:hypothetical protein